MEAPADRKMVLVTRRTRLEELLVRFHTLAQAQFYIEHMGADFADYQKEHEQYQAALRLSLEALESWGRFQRIDRSFLPKDHLYKTLTPSKVYSWAFESSCPVADFQCPSYAIATEPVCRCEHGSWKLTRQKHFLNHAIRIARCRVIRFASHRCPHGSTSLRRAPGTAQPCQHNDWPVPALS